jgi:hypothetical protein
LDSFVDIDIKIDPDSGIPGDYRLPEGIVDELAAARLEQHLDRAAEECRRRIEAAAQVAYSSNTHALELAAETLIALGVPIEEIEIISEPHRGPGAWRVRRRRKVCECGRSV